MSDTTSRAIATTSPTPAAIETAQALRVLKPVAGTLSTVSMQFPCDEVTAIALALDAFAERVRQEERERCVTAVEKYGEDLWAQARAKGWRMPANAVYVGRPTRWGNPFNWQSCPLDAGPPNWARGAAVDLYREWLQAPARFPDKPPPPLAAEIGSHLRGMDLVCWCPLTDKDGYPVPCHADVLIELANAEPPGDG